MKTMIVALTVCLSAGMTVYAVASQTFSTHESTSSLPSDSSTGPEGSSQSQTDQGSVPGSEQTGVSEGQSSQAQAAPGSTDREMLERLLGVWPEDSARVARAMIDKYGIPQDASALQITWLNNSPWKRTVIFRDGADHNFPSRHKAILEQAVSYRVPLKKTADVLAFDGSLIIDRTRGELASRSDSEEHNLLALNVADEICNGKRKVSGARDFVSKTSVLSMSGKSSPYVERLLFEPAQGSADPDEQTIKEGESDD
jgi:hypothetical protein